MVPNSEGILEEKKIIFPERILENVNYNLDISYAGMYRQISDIISNKLKMAYYQLLEYKKEGVLTEAEKMALGRMIGIGGIFKTIVSRSWRRQIRFHEFKNTISMLLKNYELRNFLRVLPVTFFIMLSLSLFPATRGDLSASLDRLSALFRAAKWILINLKSIWEKRLVTQYLIRNVSDVKITRMMMKKPVVLKLIF